MTAAAKRKPRPAASDDYRLQAQVGFLLRKAHQAATESFLATMDGIDVTPRQFSVLITLLQRGETGLGLLGELTAMDPATLLGVVRRLARRKLLVVRGDPEDGRRRIAQLTRQGQDLAAHLITLGPQVSERTLGDFAPEERATLLALLERLGNRREAGA
ncbi:MAG: MarR family winged helix-turn-helix transcriptional regulator [Kiloniellales bacterium]